MVFRRVLSTAIMAASAQAVAPSYKDALLTSMPVRPQIMVWYSKIAWRVPWLISG